MRGEKVARIRTVRPGFGEVFYVRLLLLHCAARSFEQLRTVNGVLHDTFQRAAQAAGLLEEDNEGRLAMEDAVADYKSANQLRFLFVMLIVEGAGAIELWDRFKDDLARDFLGNTYNAQPPLICDHAHNHALEAIDWLLSEHGKTTTIFGLPAVKVHSAEVRADLDYFNAQAANLNSMADRSIAAMTPDQRAIFDILYADIFGDMPSCTPLHFLTGKAGRGKSFIVKVLVARARGMGHIVAVCGTTALSVLDVDGGHTAHSMFKLPVSDDNTGIESGIVDDSDRAEYLREAVCIVWDELPMANIAAFMAVDKVLRSIMQNDLPFGGKIIIAIGDFCQVAPVVKGGGPSACYMASVLSSPLWQAFQIHQLTAPMRNASDIEFADFVDSIGEDTTGARIKLRPYLHHTSDLDEIEHRLYPDSILQDPFACVRRAFLTPLNVDVDKFNSGILHRLPGRQCEILFSIQ